MLENLKSVAIVAAAVLGSLERCEAVEADDSPTTQTGFLAAQEEYLLGDIKLCEQKTGARLPKKAVELILRAVEVHLFESDREVDRVFEAVCLEQSSKEDAHPLVKLWSARTLFGAGRISRARGLLKEAEPQLADLELLRARADCLDLLLEIELFGLPTVQRETLVALDEALLALAEADNELATQRFVFALVFHRYQLTLSIDKQGDFAQRFWESRKVNAWTRNLLMGCYHNDLGWEIRGDGYALEVPEEAWPRFYEELETAASFFRAAWEMDSSKPEPAARMIMVAKAHDDSVTPRGWFDRAVQAQVDYRHAYLNYLWSLRPRWGGSTEEMRLFAEECRDTNRFDTDVPLFYIDVAWSIISEVEELAEAPDRPLREEFYSEVNKVLSTAAKHPARRQPKSGLIAPAQLESAQLNYAMNWGRNDLVATLADKLVESYDPTYSKRLNLGARQAREIDTAVAMTEELSAQLGLLSPTGTESREEYFAKFAKLAQSHRELSKTAKDKRAKRLFNRLATETEQLATFYKGQWTQLDLDAPYGTWIVADGHWRPQSAQVVEGRISTVSDAMTMWSYASFVGPLELEAVIEPLESYGWQPRMGLLVGHLTKRDPTDEASAKGPPPHGRCFWIDPASGFVGADFGARPGRAHRVLKPAPLYKMNVKAWKGFYVVLINDEFIFARRSDGFEPDGYIGLGCVSHTKCSQETRFSKMRVRRLFYDVPPRTDNHEELIAYYDRVLAYHPEDPWGLSQRGRAYYDQADYPAAVADLQRVVSRDDLHPANAIYLATSFAQIGKHQEAIRLLETRIEGKHATNALNSLAWLLATCPDAKSRDGKRAVSLATRAAKATEYSEWRILDTLAAAYAEAGDFKNATRWQTKVIELNHDETQIEQLRHRLTLYSSSQPYHQVTVETKGAAKSDLEFPDP